MSTTSPAAGAPPLVSPEPESPSKKRKLKDGSPAPTVSATAAAENAEVTAASSQPAATAVGAEATPDRPPPKKQRTNTPWTPAEEKRLKVMRDESKTWSEIAKTFPNRTEGSVKKHWYKDMHYADFAEDETQALLQAIKEYDANKWKTIGQKVGKPAKACEQYAKEHFAGRM